MIVYYAKASLMWGFFCGVSFLRAHCIWVVWGIICNFVL